MLGVVACKTQSSQAAQTEAKQRGVGPERKKVRPSSSASTSQAQGTIPKGK